MLKVIKQYFVRIIKKILGIKSPSKLEDLASPTYPSTLEGRILLFDTVNESRDIFTKDCKIDIPEKVPLTWDFNHEKVIGFANVTKDNKGLVARAETFSNEIIGVEDLRSIFEDGKIGAGGYYTNVKKHSDGSFIVVDEAKLREVALVLAPVNEEYLFKIAKEDNKDD